MMPGPLDVTVIVPVVERPEPLAELYEEYARPLREAGYSYEFVFVTHPWYSALTLPLKQCATGDAVIRIVEFGQGVSETSMLRGAASSARGRIVVTLPAYRQVEASAVPALVARVEEGIDLAVARRWPRRDSLVNRLQNRLLHLAIGNLAGGRLHDVACGVRAMRPHVMEETRIYGDFSRFFPLMAMREGFSVDEVPSPVHPRAMRSRVYSPGVYLRRLIDVLGLTFLLRFTDKPLRFFGLVGSVMSMAGLVLLVVIVLERQFADRGLANRPIFLLGVLLLTLGAQAIALGLIGEMIVHLSAPRRRIYRLKDRQPDRQAGERQAVGALAAANDEVLNPVSSTRG